MKVKLIISGMSCANCANIIRNKTAKMQGVKDAKIEFATSSGVWEVEDASVVEELKKSVKKLGFGVVSDFDELFATQEEKLKNAKQKCVLSALAAVVVMALEMSFSGGVWWVVFAIFSTLATLFLAKEFLSHAFLGLKTLSFDMNSLISLGVISALIYSLLALFGVTNEVYFSSPLMILFFVWLGRFLEGRTKSLATKQISNLLNLQPKTAQLKSGEVVPCKELKVGDEFVVKSGQSVAVDGVVVSGEARLDASALTGEATAVNATKSCEVFGGSVCGEGFLVVKALKTHAQSLATQIADELLAISSKETKTTKLADAIAQVFVPVVTWIALVTLFSWGFLQDFEKGAVSAIAVLLISCPCALGLAVPIALVCSVSRASKFGVVVKNPQLFEELCGVKKFFFDKTMTLTTAEFEMSFCSLSEVEVGEFLPLMTQSSHPLSRAFLNSPPAKEAGKKMSKSNLILADFTAATGGVSAKVGEVLKLAGNARFLEANGVKIPQSEVAQNSVIYFARVAKEAEVAKFVGKMEFKNTLAPHAKELVEFLQNEGFECAILSGDNRAAVEVVAREVSVKEFHANCLPQDKLAILRQSPNSAFVGDGVNDALVLKEAKASFALGGGSDLAKLNTDAVLLGCGLLGVKNALLLARKSRLVVRENLAWAFGYNALCIPLAAGLFGFSLTPHIASLAMSLSSICVVLNSLRLLKAKI